MAGPKGSTEIFTCYNEQGSSKFSKVKTVDGKRVAKGRFEAGTCAGMSGLFLRRMLDQGSVTASEVGGNVAIRMVKGGVWSASAHQTAIAQSAYETMGGLAIKRGGDPDDVVPEARKLLLEGFGLKVVSTTSPTVEESTVVDTLQALVNAPAYYFFGTPSHNMGIVTEVTKAWFFDPDEGLYKWEPATSFAQNLADYLKQCYSDDLGERWDFLKVELP